LNCILHYTKVKKKIILKNCISMNTLMQCSCFFLVSKQNIYPQNTYYNYILKIISWFFGNRRFFTKIGWFTSFFHQNVFYNSFSWCFQNSIMNIIYHRSKLHKIILIYYLIYYDRFYHYSLSDLTEICHLQILVRGIFLTHP